MIAIFRLALVILASWAAAVGAAAQSPVAAGSTNTSPGGEWGVLGDLAGRDFIGCPRIVSERDCATFRMVRWQEPGRVLVVNQIARSMHITDTISLDAATGRLSVVRDYSCCGRGSEKDVDVGQDGAVTLWVGGGNNENWHRLPSGEIEIRIGSRSRGAFRAYDSVSLRPLASADEARRARAERLRTARGISPAAPEPEPRTELALDAAADPSPSQAPPAPIQVVAGAPSAAAVAPPPAPPAETVAALAGERPQTRLGDSVGARVALVIGVSNYGSLGNLANPANDARELAARLRDLGFEVELVTDPDQRALRQAISRLGARMSSAGSGATGLFFFAGHGIQARGINYLIPAGAEIAREADLALEAIPADTVLLQMQEAGVSTNILILDACRNMPLTRSFRNGGRGLAQMEAPNGTFIAYSTAPGSVAADGEGANSPFATALLREIGRPGQPIEAVFRNVRRSVLRATDGLQTPWDSSSLLDPFYFLPG